MTPTDMRPLDIVPNIGLCKAPSGRIARAMARDYAGLAKLKVKAAV